VIRSASRKVSFCAASW